MPNAPARRRRVTPISHGAPASGIRRATLAAVAALGIVAATPAAADDGLWTGSIGQAAVVVELDSSGTSTDGRYFYRIHRLDLDLRASHEHARVWIEYGNGGDIPIAHWAMRSPPAATGAAWEGTWVGRNGRTLPIRLQVLAPAAAADEAITTTPDIDAYARARLDGLQLVPTRVESRHGYQLQWQRETTTGIELFEVLSGYPEPARIRINQALRTSLWQAVNGRFECLSAPRARDYTFTATLRYISDDAISLSRLTGSDCGGPHPDAVDSPLTLDARSGKPLALEDVFFVAGGTLSRPPANDDERGSDAYFDYQDRTLAPAILGILKMLYPREMAAPANASACDYSSAAIWSMPSWYLLPAGLYLGPSMSAAERGCEQPAFPVLPWSQVRRHPGPIRVGPQGRPATGTGSDPSI